MKIEKLTIENFKGTDHLEFAPKKINIVTGRNNTGKTSLLQAIDILFNTEKINDEYRRHLSALINVHHNESQIKASSGEKLTELIIKKPDVRVLGLEFKKELLIILKGMDRITGKKFTPEIEEEMDKELNRLIDQELVSELSNESIETIKDGKERIYFSFTSRKITDFVEKISKEISKILKDKFKLKVDPFLLRYLIVGEIIADRGIKKMGESVKFIEDLRIREIQVVRKEDAIKISEIDNYIKKHKLINHLDRFQMPFLLFRFNGKAEGIPYDSMGDGFKALVGLLWLSGEKERNEVILIEEAEKHMHPGYVYELVKFIVKFSKEMNMQFFITTHNSDLVESFLDENLTEEEKKYLEKELMILRMEKEDKYTVPHLLNYQDAKTNFNELRLDLRGT